MSSKRAPQEESYALRCRFALEVNLDRRPTKDSLWKLVAAWLDAAKRAELSVRHPDYVKALERALVVMSKASSPQRAIEILQAR